MVCDMNYKHINILLIIYCILRVPCSRASGEKKTLPVQGRELRDSPLNIAYGGFIFLCVSDYY